MIRHWRIGSTAAVVMVWLAVGGVGCKPPPGGGSADKKETVPAPDKVGGESGEAATAAEGGGENRPGSDRPGSAASDVPGTTAADSAGTEDAAAPPADPVAAPANRVVSGDWPMWGGTIHRNMVNSTTGISIDFQPAEKPEDGKSILWTAQLGSQTYGNPVVAAGKVFVGTNNGAEYRPQHKGDRGCLLAFDEKTGEFLWQLTREKLPQGRVNDWPEQGICSTACVEGDRLWVVTNRCELMCLDTEGFRDDENDGD